MINIINFTPNGTGDIWINIILWLVNISSVVGGVVLFTLLLKLVTFPFDFMSRWSMRKNSVKMEQMRPELEKLQRQYADNKQMYNQKMMALYKKNGYSMFGACLPTILTLVIFIIAINGFQSYAGYQNREYFYNMSVAYNNVAYAGFETDDNYIVRDEKGEITIKTNELYELYNAGQRDVTSNGVTINFNVETENAGQPNEINRFKVWTANGYVRLIKGFKADGSLDEVTKYEVIESALQSTTLKNSENNNLTIIKDGATVDFANSGMTADAFIRDIQEQKSAEKYREEQASFLWIKNIWVTDSAMSHPIQSDWKMFKATHGYNGNDIGEDNYKALISKLEFEKTAPNGYFILIALSIVVSFVMQVVTTKSQQAQMELQTVDGKGMQTQKTMKWMMPIMMAVFSFMYTAAFSIYIIISSTLSVITTLGINYFVDKKFAKEIREKAPEQVRGRVYVEKEQPKEEKPKKKSKDEKFAHESKGDFLDGKSTRGHIRGRIK